MFVLSNKKNNIQKSMSHNDYQINKILAIKYSIISTEHDRVWLMKIIKSAGNTQIDRDAFTYKLET